MQILTGFKHTFLQCIVILAIFICNIHSTSYAQISYPGVPAGVSYNKRNISYVQLPQAGIKVDAEKQYRQNNHVNSKIDIVGKVHTLNVNMVESATWIVDRYGNRHGYIGFVSENASSLGLTFSPFQLKPGCKVFLYSPDRKNVQGAYTFRNNKATGSFITNSIDGDTLIVEVKVNAGVSDMGLLTVKSVCIGFADELQKSITDEWYGSSAECHVDINCIDDDDIQKQKYSACRLITEDDNVRIRCSGTLINSASADKLPYLLTAGHCIDDEFAAHNTLVFLDYESPYCNGPDGVIKSMSGTNLIANNPNLDFALLKIMENPPVDYYPLYSGWNISSRRVESTYSIHHPYGDVKKIAYDSSQVQIDHYSGYDLYSHWLVEKYEIGSTQQGSSGSALFNPDNQIIGVLSGGNAVCSEYIYDYYQQISRAWADYRLPQYQLKAWLDPDDTGITQLGNYDPYSGIFEELSNINPLDNLQLKSYSPWGYVAGHNAQHTTEYTEHFYKNGTKYIYALNMHVAKAYSGNEDSQVVIKIRDGKDKPGNVLFEKPFYISEFEPNGDNYIRLGTLVAVNKDFYIGYEIQYGSPLDTFALKTSYTALKTLSNTNTNTNTAFANNDGRWYSLSDGVNELDASLGIVAHVSDYYPQSDPDFQTYPTDDITLYPNPSHDMVQLLFKSTPSGLVKTSVYDVYGRLVQVNEFMDVEQNIRLYTDKLNRSGVYFLWIEYEGKKTVKKFISLQ